MNILLLWPWLIPAALAAGAIWAAKKSRTNRPGPPKRRKNRSEWDEYHRKVEVENNFFISALILAVLAIMSVAVILNWTEILVQIKNSWFF